MPALRLSLRHADLLHVSSAVTFLKHIEGSSMSGPELALDDATHGDLKALLRLREMSAFETLDADVGGDRVSAYIINFHKKDLPFSYRSVDRYAKNMLQVASATARERKRGPIVFCTAVHGPGAGLDASEAMETMIRAFAEELSTNPQLVDDITEIILAEREKEVFARLQERLSFLVERNVVSVEDGSFLIGPLAPEDRPNEEARVEQLALRHMFVAMPYAREFDNVYYFGIKLPVENLKRICERVDQDAFTGDIVDRIKARIRGCELVIADLSKYNPNVYFEIGYAEGLGKTVILLSQDQETPFDFKTRRQIRYDPQDLRALGEALTVQLQDSLAHRAPTNAVSTTR